jgi:RNA polymerase sigma-70 factor, ECF subfamily
VRSTTGQPQHRALRLVRASRTDGAAQTTDDELVSAFERGDAALGEMLYDRLIVVVENTLWRVLGARGPDHEDLVQSAFEQILITLSDGRFARTCSLRSWAAAITCNLALNAVRSRSTERKYFDRKPTPEECQSATWASDPERNTTVRQDLALVRSLLATMNPKLAQAVILHDVLGHDLAEVSTLTGVSVSAAQSRLVRGRRSLEELLAAKGLKGKP